MKWRRLEEITNEQVIEVAERLGINALVARILLNRGMTEEQIKLVLLENHETILEPELLTNAKAAAERIAAYCRDPQAEIWIFGDYDADGVDSTYIMTGSLREVAQCEVNYYIPERREGYGLSMSFCERLVAGRDPSIKTLVITVDNGIACVEQAAYLKANGIEIIVTDHHMAKDEVPDCLIVDPHNHGEPDTFKHLAGCGVAFKVAQLVQREFGVYNMHNYLFAVAIGTVADCMPLSLENISLIKYGLEQMNSDYCPAGIKALKDFMGKKTLTSTDLGWEIGPRINACGRLGNIGLAAELFFTEDKTAKEIEEIVNAIERINAERKSYSDKAKKAIEKMSFDNDPVCFIDATGYPEGVVGIIANKAIEKFNKPVVVLAGEGEKMTGSARSVGGINLHEVLAPEHEAGNIVGWGGHEAAAGLQIERQKFDVLKENVAARMADIVSNMDLPAEPAEQELIIDELVDIVHINESTYELINCVPYDDRSLPAPVFALCDVAVSKVSYSKNNPNNICLNLEDETGKIEIWGWGLSELYKSIGEPKRLHIAGVIERDFRNKKSFTLKIKDMMGA